MAKPQFFLQYIIFSFHFYAETLQIWSELINAILSIWVYNPSKTIALYWLNDYSSYFAFWGLLLWGQQQLAPVGQEGGTTMPRQFCWNG